MSEFHVTATRIKDISTHPNADSLEIAQVFDYRAIIRKGEFSVGELVVYLPLESVVPDTEQWHYLCPKQDGGGVSRYEVGQVPLKYRTIEAKKIRGIFSQGLIVKLPEGNWVEGDDLQQALQITRAPDPSDLESTKPKTGGDCESPPKGYVIPIYTDIESMKRHSGIFQTKDDVVLTEKVHGTSSRYLFDGERLWVGSHRQLKKYDKTNLWWQVAERLNFAEKLARVPMYIFYGEVYGQVQDLKYGIKQGATFRAFDVFSVKTGRYLDFDEARDLATSVGIDWVPILYRGPWHEDLKRMCEGMSTIPGAEGCIREGIVVRPSVERYDHKIGRVVLKLVGEGYLLRKKK
jgi:RNA ligase (TIGR02306 family)